jgi:hypothetical protein
MERFSLVVILRIIAPRRQASLSYSPSYAITKREPAPGKSPSLFECDLRTTDQSYESRMDHVEQERQALPPIWERGWGEWELDSHRETIGASPEHVAPASRRSSDSCAYVLDYTRTTLNSGVHLSLPLQRYRPPRNCLSAGLFPVVFAQQGQAGLCGPAAGIARRRFAT